MPKDAPPKKKGDQPQSFKEKAVSKAPHDGGWENVPTGFEKTNGGWVGGQAPGTEPKRGHTHKPAGERGTKTPYLPRKKLGDSKSHRRR